MATSSVTPFTSRSASVRRLAPPITRPGGGGEGVCVCVCVHWGWVDGRRERCGGGAAAPPQHTSQPATTRATLSTHPPTVGLGVVFHQVSSHRVDLQCQLAGGGDDQRAWCVWVGGRWRGGMCGVGRRRASTGVHASAEAQAACALHPSPHTLTPLCSHAARLTRAVARHEFCAVQQLHAWDKEGKGLARAW